jgi:hypothetical protein
MAITQGFVQRLKVTGTSVVAWVYLGPTPANTELLIVQMPIGIDSREATARASMIDALSAALVSRQEVQATHPDGSADITMVQIPPP